MSEKLSLWMVLPARVRYSMAQQIYRVHKAGGTLMQGKVCLVTGANAGLGKTTALGLAKLGATVTLACRDQARGEAALAEIKTASSNDALELLLVDLSSLESVRRAAAEFSGRHQHLDVLINNAGIFKNQR